MRRSPQAVGAITLVPVPRLLNVMVWLTAALSACSFDSALPGAERVGTYDLRAEPTFRACSLDDVTAQPFPSKPVSAATLALGLLG